MLLLIFFHFDSIHSLHLSFLYFFMYNLECENYYYYYENSWRDMRNMTNGTWKKIFFVRKLVWWIRYGKKMKKIPLWHKKNISKNFSLLAFIILCRRKKQHKIYLILMKWRIMLCIYYLPFSTSLVFLGWVCLSISYFYDGKFLIVYKRLAIPCCLHSRGKIGR